MAYRKDEIRNLALKNVLGKFTLKNIPDARRRGASSGAYYFRYVSSAATKATQEMGIFQREISRELVNWKIGELALTNL